MKMFLSLQKKHGLSFKMSTKQPGGNKAIRLFEFSELICQEKFIIVEIIFSECKIRH
jgi:hypothetical protein